MKVIVIPKKWNKSSQYWVGGMMYEKLSEMGVIVVYSGIKYLPSKARGYKSAYNWRDKAGNTLWAKFYT